MIEATIAKFRCYEVQNYGPSQRVKLNAAYEGPLGDNQENRRFYAASPSGHLELTVDNPSVHGFFERDRYYYLEIRRAPVAASAK